MGPKRAIAWACGLVVAGVALFMLVAGVAVVVEDFFIGGRSAKVATAGASLAMAGATIGLILGSFLATWYLRLQVLDARRASEATLREPRDSREATLREARESREVTLREARESREVTLREAKESREASLRPVLVFQDAAGGNLRVSLSEFDDTFLRIRNVGPGPARDVYVHAWDRHDYDRDPLDPGGEPLDAAAPTYRGGPELIGSGDDTAVFVSRFPSRAQEIRPTGPLYLRITYKDVFGNEFATPPQSAPQFQALFVRGG